MIRLRGKTAIVTGSSRGIGRSIADTLIQSGASVVVTYNKNKKMAEEIIKKDKSGKSIALQLEISNRASIRTAKKTVLDTFNSIDILINNAAIAQEKPFDTITDEDWDRMMSVNLRGPFAFSQEVLPHMIKQNWGRIVNISSIGGIWGGFNQVHYASAKAGLINLTKSLAKIYSKDEITVNAVAPGLVATDMSKNELNTRAGKKKVESTPIGRIANLEEVSNVVLFLCSNEASYITGQTINVNGGMYFG